MSNPSSRYDPDDDSFVYEYRADTWNKYPGGIHQWRTELGREPVGLGCRVRKDHHVSRIYRYLFWLVWPIVRRHLDRCTVTSCWLEAWLTLRNDRHGINETARSAAMHFAKAMEER